MSSPIITAEIFDAFLKCESKAYFKSSGQIGEPDELANWRREVRQEFRRSCQLRYRSIFQDAFDASQPLPLNEVKSGKHHILFDCGIEAGQFQSRIDAVEKVTRLSRMKYRGYIPIRFVPNEKLSRHDKLLLAFDAYTLSLALGTTPTIGKIMHGMDQRTVTIRLAPLISVVRLMVEKICTQTTSPEPPQLVLNKHCIECEFKARCRALAEEKGSLSLLPRMSRLEREKLHDKGIFTVQQLSYTFRPRRKARQLASRPDKHSHALKALAIRERKIHVVGKIAVPAGGPDIFLDIEGVPDRGFYYLIGLRIRNGDSYARHAFWADDIADEEEIWASLVNILAATRNPRLIHYGSFETTFFRRMKQRYPEVTKGFPSLDGLLAQSVNPLQVITAHVYFPTYSNSLKEIASHLGFRWSESTPSGLRSLMLRSKWEQTQDPRLKERLITYNAEDCAALEVVFDSVWRLSERQDNKDMLSDEGVIHAESIRVNDNSLRFGRIEFLLPELDYINKAAYWDYQRSKVYVKSNRRLRRLARLQHGPRTSARKLRPNKIIKCEPPRPSTCPRCKAGKIYKYGKLSKTVYDLKLGPTGVKRWIVKYYYPRFLCWHCKTAFLSHQAHWSRSKYGVSFLAYLLYNIVDLTLSQSTVARIFSRFLGFDLGRGAINNLKARAAQIYKDTYERILANIVRGKLVHADETKVSLQGQSAFVWIFTNLEEVAYVYSDERSNETPKTVLSDFNGVLVSDFYAGYDSINCRQQKCLVHLMRDFNEDLLKQPFNEELRTLIQDFAAVLRPMVQTVDRFGLKARFLRKHLRSVDHFYRELAERDFRSEAALKYKKRFQRNHERLFTFLEFDGVPWNNNNAEHAVKALADLRNVIGGTSSARGIRDYLVLLSICQTCKYKGVDFLEFVRSGERDIDCTRKLSRPFLTAES